MEIKQEGWGGGVVTGVWSGWMSVEGERAGGGGVRGSKPPKTLTAILTVNLSFLMSVADLYK